MSGDCSSVHCQVVADEFIDALKTLAVSQAPGKHGELIEQLHVRLQRAIPNGLNENKAFAYTVIDNLYRIVPVLDAILSSKDEHHNEFVQATLFLETLSQAFKEMCFFDVLLLLKNTDRVNGIFRNYIGLLKESYFTADKRYDGLVCCILPIIGFSSILTVIKVEQIPSNMFSYLLAFTKTYWHTTERESVVRMIFTLLKIFSKNPTVIPLIIESHWPHACVEWLSCTNPYVQSRPSYTVDHYTHLILQKIARHPAGVQVLNELNCLQSMCDVREQLQKCHTEAQFKCLDFLQCMIYTLLIESDQIKHMTMLDDSIMCHTLSQLVEYTIAASQDERLCHECFHVSEMLIVLCKVFVNDDILTKCMNGNNRLFECLGQLLVHFADMVSDTSRIHQPWEDEVLLSLTNLLWSISFHRIYHEKFQSNTMLMHTISNLAASSALYLGTQTKSIPRDLCSLKKATEGILWNLKSSSSSAGRPTSNVSDQDSAQRPLVMISYSHSDSVFCRELVERLSVHVPVWVDYKQAHDAIAHSDDLWEEIASAMEKATVIILIISKEYYDSKSCRQELSYASDTLKKRIVPIYAPNQQYRASGWLGIRIAGQKYVHFGRKLFPDAVKELASMVENEQKPHSLTSPVCHSASTACAESTPTKNVEEEDKKLLALQDWSAKDIRQWFDDNHIHKDLITLYADLFHTGTALIVYARHLKLFYRNEYIRAYTKYYKIFHGKKLDTLEFVTFVDALYRLRLEYDPNGMVEDAYEKYSEQSLPRKIKTAENGSTWL